METLDGLGLFWLPGHENDALSGRLKFDPTGGGTRLQVVGRFDNEPQYTGDATTRIVGWLGNDPVTLDRAFGGSSFRSPGPAESDYYANALYVGHQFDSDRELSFQSVILELGDLGTWVGKTGVRLEQARTFRPEGSDPIYKMEFTPPADESCEFSRGRVSLSYRWRPEGDPIRGTALRQWPVIRIDYADLEPIDTILKDVGRAESLVTLCMDSLVPLDEMVLLHPNIKMRAISGREFPALQPIQYLAPRMRYREPAGREPLSEHKMLLLFDEIGGLSRVAKWLDISQRFERVLNSLVSIRRAEQMFAENRFQNVTFAAEAFHRLIIGGTQMGREEYDNLFGAYAELTPEQHKYWLHNKLDHGNEPTLRKRLRELASRSAPATKPLIGDKDKWAFTLAGVRNELTHLGDNSREFDGGDLNWFTESVYSVMRVCMLLECGVEASVLARKAESGQAIWYRDRLQASIQSARARLLKPAT